MEKEIKQYYIVENHTLSETLKKFNISSSVFYRKYNLTKPKGFIRKQTLTDEQRQFKRESMLGNKRNFKENKIIVVKAKFGSEEHRQKLSESHIGKTMSEESKTKRKITISNNIEKEKQRKLKIAQTMKEFCKNKVFNIWQDLTADKKQDMLYKMNETKKQNDSYGKSKMEESFYVLLKTIHKNIERQYKSDVYPFACDFYLKDKDIYIEFQGHWTHGGEIFDLDNERHLEKYMQWQNKSTESKFYENAIKTWTIRDIEKIEFAKKNNVKLVLFYPVEKRIVKINCWKYEIGIETEGFKIENI